MLDFPRQSAERRTPDQTAELKTYSAFGINAGNWSGKAWLEAPEVEDFSDENPSPGH